MAMTTTTETFVAAARRSQEAYLQVWTDAMYRFFGLLPTPDAKEYNPLDPKVSVPTDEEVVDHAFDYADALLDIQRACVKSLVVANRSFSNSPAWMPKDKDKGADSKKS
jgi:hypothetical protein